MYYKKNIKYHTVFRGEGNESTFYFTNYRFPASARYSLFGFLAPLRLVDLPVFLHDCEVLLGLAGELRQPLLLEPLQGGAATAQRSFPLQSNNKVLDVKEILSR